MAYSKFIDVLRNVRDAGLPINDSFDLREYEIELTAVSTLEDAVGDDLLWILMAAAQQKGTKIVIASFKYTCTAVEKYTDFLYDELERCGFDATFVGWDAEHGLCTMRLPLFTLQEEDLFYREGVFPPWMELDIELPQ